MQTSTLNASPSTAATQPTDVDPPAANLVSENVIADADSLAQVYASASPLKHVVIDNFFQSSVAERMLAEFPGVDDPSTLRNEFGGHNPKSAISDMVALGGIYAELDKYIQKPAFLELVGKITGIHDLCYDPEYFGAGTHENFHGAGLDAHYDFNIHPTTGKHRRLNAIVYLNKDWNPDWNGSIAFHSDPWDLQGDQIIEFQPTFNRCVIFETTEQSWHSVPIIDIPVEFRNQSRKSFTIYLYSNNRPAEEIAPAHGTVYVQGSLPKHIQIGRTLTEDDMNCININIQRRHQYLRAMYAREYGFSEQISDLKYHISRLTEYIGHLERRLHIPMLGYGVLREVIEPMYGDGWMGKRLTMIVEPRRPVRGIQVTGWNADDIPEPVELTLRVGDCSAGRVLDAGSFALSLLLENPFSNAVELSIEASCVRPGGDHDRRLLSVMISSIELIH